MPEHLIVGQITKAHGTKGEVFVWPLTDVPGEVFFEDREVLVGDEDGRLGEATSSLEIEAVRPFKRGVLVKFRGFEDRTAAEPLGGRYLFLPSEALRPLEEDEVFYHQLLGAQVYTVDGALVGTVREVFDTEPAHLLEVKSEAGRLHLVPFVKRIVKQVDVPARRLVIDPPAGLLD